MGGNDLLRAALIMLRDGILEGIGFADRLNGGTCIGSAPHTLEWVPFSELPTRHGLSDEQFRVIANCNAVLRASVPTL
jgi:hypothetical protein